MIKALFKIIGLGAGLTLIGILGLCWPILIAGGVIAVISFVCGRVL